MINILFEQKKMKLWKWTAFCGK